MMNKFISKDTLEYLSLHDCTIENVRFEKSELILELDHVDVLETHPLNPNLTAKSSGKAIMRFENCSVKKCFIYDTSKVEKQVIKIEDATIVNVELQGMAKNFEILEVMKKEPQEKKHAYAFSGECSYEYRSEFGEFLLEFDEVSIGWDDLSEDAWFSGYRNHKDM